METKKNNIEHREKLLKETFGNRTPYSTPEHYFVNLNERIQDKISTENEDRKTARFLIPALSMVFVAFVGVFFFFLLNQSQNELELAADQSSIKAYENYLINDEVNIDDNEFYAYLDVTDIEKMETTEEIENEIIIEYLEEIDLEINDLYDEF